MNSHDIVVGHYKSRSKKLETRFKHNLNAIWPLIVVVCLQKRRNESRSNTSSEILKAEKKDFERCG